MQRFPAPAAAVPAILLALAGVTLGEASAAELDLPWRQAGLSEREAAAHLLDRLAFGPRPGEVDRVVAMGLEAWLASQLAVEAPEESLDGRLDGLRSLGMSTREVAETYPNPGMVLLQARRAGSISEEDVASVLEGADGGDAGPGATRRELIAYARDRGYRPQRELIAETMTQKLYRALYAEAQLREVLADFWLNHFNVSITDNEARPYVATYERDAVRPHVLGDFRAMLEATAKHPAMLLYLDNARSVVEEGAPTTLDARLASLRVRPGDCSAGRRGGFRRGGRAGGGDAVDLLGSPQARRFLEERRPEGLNENYARELMELHTLGVDGGYTQADVVAVARAFTGWTTYPPGEMRERIEERLARARRIGETGFVFESDFLFRADAHDAGEKVVLGRHLAAGRGIEDGEEVLDLLAAHPSTARHLARKLAVRFVADDPPEGLVERLAVSFTTSGGDLRRVMVSLVESPEFWSPESRAQKIKSPFELAVSALRALGAEVVEPRGTLEWISRMGQPLYAYQAPTGYPDRADAWVNSGSLLNRMSFGLELAAGRVGGVRFDLAALNRGREPESLEAALETYVPLLLPERDPAETLERLLPLVGEPELARRLEAAAPASGETTGAYDAEAELMLFFSGRGAGGGMEEEATTLAAVDPPPRQLAHVVGVILGSPEFQRR